MTEIEGGTLSEFDPVLHSPVRLKVMMLLAETGASSFNELRDAANVTDGNLATHLKVLENADYLEGVRGFINLKPRVRYAITAKGRLALSAYAKLLLEVASRIEGTRGSAALGR
ncbi:MAG: transcriptional regulator [Thermoplasmatota archaeon]